MAYKPVYKDHHKMPRRNPFTGMTVAVPGQFLPQTGQIREVPKAKPPHIDSPNDPLPPQTGETK